MSCVKKLIDLALENISSKEMFLFQIRCAECGVVHTSKPVRFTKAGIIPETKGKAQIYQVLYEQETQRARQEAVKDAVAQMNCCPICKRVICNRCFLICEDLDMCSRCAARLEEQGSPVLSDALEMVI